MRRMVVGLGALLLVACAHVARAPYVAHHRPADSRTDLRCKDGCILPLLRTLPGGSTPAQVGTGSIVTTNGVPVTDTRASSVTCGLSSGISQLEANPEAFNLWAAGGINVAAPTVTANATTSPFGASTADEVDYPSIAVGGGASSANEDFTATGTDGYTFSVYAKAKTSNGTVYVYVDGSPGGVLTFYSAPCAAITSAWTRCSVSTTVIASGLWHIFVGYDSRDTSQAFPVSAQNFYLSSAKLEKGGTATPIYGVTLSSNQPCVEANGLRVEGAATNLALQSQAPATAPWTTNSVIVAAPTVTNNAAVAPDGTTTAATVAIPAVGASQASNIYQGFTATAAAYTASVYTRSSGAASTAYIFFGNSPYTASACSITSTWTRCSVTATLTAATWFAQFGVDTRAGGMTAQAAQTVQFWGFQVEAQSFASSYIPTTTVTVTRAADSLTLPNPLTNGGTWSIAATVLPYALLPVTQGIVGLGTSYGSANFALLNLNTSGFPALYIFDSGAVQHAANGGSTISVASHRIAGATVGGAMTLYVDGASVGTQTGGVMASQPATIMLGQQQSGGTGPFNGYLYNICVDPSPTRCR